MCSIGLEKKGVMSRVAERRGHRAWFWVGIGALVVAVVAGSHVRNPSFPGRADLTGAPDAKPFRPLPQPGGVGRVRCFPAARLRGLGQRSGHLSLQCRPPRRRSRCVVSPSAPAIRSLLRSPMHIGPVEVEGLRINLPPRANATHVSRTGKIIIARQGNASLSTRWTAPTPCSPWARTSRAKSRCVCHPEPLPAIHRRRQADWTLPPS